MPEFNKNFNRQTLTMAEVEARPEFHGRLNEQQQNFVRHWINSGGDQTFSFEQSYSAPDAETARRGAYAVLQKTSIKNAIDAFLMKTDKERFLEELERACRSRKITPSKLKLFELRAATEFGVDLKTLKAEAQSKKSGKAEAALAVTKRHKVGDVIDYDGKKVRVTKIDEDGQAVEGDPVEMVMMNSRPVTW